MALLTGLNTALPFVIGYRAYAHHDRRIVFESYFHPEFAEATQDFSRTHTSGWFDCEHVARFETRPLWSTSNFQGPGGLHF